MEVGLDGNILTRKYDKFHHLATHSWFKILWQYADKYELSITFDHRFNLGPIRQGDMALMYLFDRLGYSSDSMEILNRCRRFHCVHSLADILRADGKTIDPVVISSQPGESTRLFSWEQPTQSDLRFWCTTIKSVVRRTIPTLTTIGNYISAPHRP